MLLSAAGCAQDSKRTEPSKPAASAVSETSAENVEAAEEAPQKPQPSRRFDDSRISTLYDVEFSYTDPNGNKDTYFYEVPQIDDDTEGARNINEMIGYRFGYLENGKFHNLMDGITFDQELYMDKFYLFGGKAYFLFGDNTYVSNGHLFYNYPLWSIDLETGAKGRAVDLDDFYMDEVAFDGATGYALEGGKDLPMSIVRFSLLQPELRETVLVLPDDASDGHRMTLFANGSDLYYFSPEAHRIWKIGKDGAMTLTALAPWGERLYDYATVTSQGTLFHDITTLRLSDSETLTVQLKNGTYVNCSDFLKLQ